MTFSFGARLRQQREERGIPLSVIAGQTKIKMSLLEGLERDDLAHWPPGIFRRAYIRAYAHAIGLNPDTLVREFLDIYPERPEIVDPAVAALEASNGASNGAPPTRLRHLVGSAVGTLSRLRRGTVVDDRVRPQGTSGTVPAAAVPPERFDDPEPVESAPPVPAAEMPDPAPLPAMPAVLATNVPLEPAAERAPDVDLLAAAELCTALGRVESADQMPPLLREAARILEARGLIVWVWDSIAEELQPALVYGYSDKILALLPSLKPDADNLTAAAFRSAETLAMNGTADASAALAVPLLTPGTCAGVLAIELPRGSEEAASVRAVATFFAAMLAQLVGGVPTASQSGVPAVDEPSRSSNRPPASFSTAV
jgi:transcriptional regulator with XRE-family HTH domain